jgi:hypothetical protein
MSDRLVLDVMRGMKDSSSSLSAMTSSSGASIIDVAVARCSLLIRLTSVVQPERDFSRLAVTLTT